MTDTTIVKLNNRIWELEKENEQLQKKNDNLVNMIARVQYRADLIKEENEQLKDKYNEQSVEYEGLEEQIERLLNFKDKVFELFNREIEHNTNAILQATNEDVDCATIGFHTKMLKRYKKELSE